MAKYISKYSGERIDNSVGTIPRNHPAEDSVLVISTTGEGSYKKISEVGVTVVQATGDSETQVMSQKIVTDSLNSKINYTDISNGLTVVDGKVKANIAKIQATDATEFAPDENGVVTIPMGGLTPGLVALKNNLGIGRANMGDGKGNFYLYTIPADDTRINTRATGWYQSIQPKNLNYAVKAALTDDKRMGTETSGTNTAFTDTEKDRACEVLGASRKLYRHYTTFISLSYGNCKLGFISLKPDAYSSAGNLSELKDVVSVEYCTIGESNYLMGTFFINPTDGDYTLMAGSYAMVISDVDINSDSFTDTVTEL